MSKPSTPIAKQITQAVNALKAGRLIAYPTESVYGIGCDPFNCNAIAELLRLKKRPMSKGFILVASHWGQVENLVDYIGSAALAQALNSWPGPTTWLFPKSAEAPHWITGDYDTIAIRISNHSVIRQLCDAFGGPIVSSSANITGQIPTRNYKATCLSFDSHIDTIIDAETGHRDKPSTIRHVITGETIRA